MKAQREVALPQAGRVTRGRKSQGGEEGSRCWAGLGSRASAAPGRSPGPHLLAPRTPHMMGKYTRCLWAAPLNHPFSLPSWLPGSRLGWCPSKAAS